MSALRHGPASVLPLIPQLYVIFRDWGQTGVSGTVCDFRLSYGRVLSRRSKIIAVNRDKTQLLKNSDMFWKPTIAIQGTLRSPAGESRPAAMTAALILSGVVGDAGSFLVELSKGLKGHRCPEDWPQALKAGDVTKESANRYRRGGADETWRSSSLPP